MNNLDKARERLSSLQVEFSDERIQAQDKSILNSKTDVNQLIPFKYEWAWQKYLDGCANHWMPQEVPMQKDIQQWKGGELTDDEKHIVTTALGFFSTADTLVANNIVLSIYERITSPEHRQYLLRQAFEEAIHAHAYQYCIESLGLDQGFTFNQYREVPEMARKMAWAAEKTNVLANKESTDSEFLDNLIAYYLVVEGIFFYTGFPSVLALGRRNLMTGVAEQFQYILRDESMHINFGVDTINQIIIENPHLWTTQAQQRATDAVIEGVVLEIDFARLMLPRGVLGMNFDMAQEYIMFMADRRLMQIGLPAQFPSAQNSLSWMSEMMDLRKEKNFFETRVTDYQVGGGLSWDD